MLSNVKLKISGMHCGSCPMNIDGELEDTEGVVEASTSYVKQQTEIIFDPEKITPDEMILVIRKLDDKYDAEVGGKNNQNT